MKKLAILGSPVAHSISPAIQNAAFRAAGLDWRYEAVEVTSEQLGGILSRMRTDGWVGANVTLPLKEAVLPLLDEIAPSATRTMAVNTIVNKGKHLVGHNTDLRGFMRDLRANWQIPGAGRCLILGAGGAARAVAFGLAQEHLDLAFIARTASHAEQLAEVVHQRHKVGVLVLRWERESFIAAGSQCELIVNATPLGMVPDEQSAPWPADVPLPQAAFVYDMVYCPRQTRLVQRARQSGLDAVSGAGMLLEQAALSYGLWTGQRAPRQPMLAALEEAIERSPARRQAEDEREVLNA